MCQCASVSAFVSACVLASFVDSQKWQQFSMAADALWYSASITRPLWPLTAHLSLFNKVQTLVKVFSPLGGWVIEKECRSCFDKSQQ